MCQLERLVASPNPYVPLCGLSNQSFELTHNLLTADALLSAFKAAVADSQAAVQEFNDLINEVKSRQVLDYAKQSQEKDPSGIAPWRHTENPDWFALDPKQVY